MARYLVCLVAVLWTSQVVITGHVKEKRPNIIFILTDDQDVTMGGELPMQKTKKLIGQAGMVFKNMFTSSPLCCPSRSSIFTGNYVHNHGALNNSVSGNCSSSSWQAGPEKNTFATVLKSIGYKTFFAGKYLNQYGIPSVGGVKHVPPGWDWWIGLVKNSVYYNYSLSVNGTREVHGGDYYKDYLTDLIGNHSLEFLNLQNEASPPFLLMLSTPACHSPYQSAPQYLKNFTTAKAPRGPSFNIAGKDKHWLIRHAPHPMSDASMKFVDEVFQKRWRTLLSVDDIVENVITLLEKKNMLNNTYVIFSSDNGFHLGQFSLPNDKRQMYEFDIRVPLMIRGPNIKAGSVSNDPVLNIDLMPTIIHLAGDAPPAEADGTSLVPLLFPKGKDPIPWRKEFLIEHQGEYNPKGYPGCPGTKYLNTCYPNCVCEDGYNNTYSCLRTLSASEDNIYCQFSDSENFQEFYNMTSDPHQLINMAKSMKPSSLASLNNRLIALSLCKGSSCRKFMDYHYS